jgi:hypothetical protein
MNKTLFIRDPLLNKPTATKHQIASQIAKTIYLNTNYTMDDRLVQLRLHQKSKWINNVVIHYKNEARPASYKQDTHQLWNQAHRETPVTNTKLIVGNRNSRNTSKLLIFVP